MNIKESNVTINVKDLDRSVSFYQSLGFNLHNRWGNYYAMLTAPGVVIGLHPTSDNNLKNSSGNVSIGFTTDDLASTKSELAKLSISYSEASEAGGQFILFADPDGTALYFIKPNW